MSPFAARLVKAFQDSIENLRDAMERGLEPDTYIRTVGEITAYRDAILQVQLEDRRYQTDDEDDEQPADHEAA